MKPTIVALILTLLPGLVPADEAAADRLRSHGPGHAEGTQHAEAPEHAEEAEHEHGEAPEHGEEVEQVHHGRAHHRNEIALFLGATDESGHDPELTLGLEYARAVAERWAIGGLVDYAGGELRNLVVGVPIFWHPGHGWKLFAAPGVEIHRGRDGESPVSAHSGEQGAADEDDSHFLVRLGAAYAFHLGERHGIEPTVALDLVDGEEVWVVGLNLTVGW